MMEPKLVHYQSDINGHRFCVVCFRILQTAQSKTGRLVKTVDTVQGIILPYSALRPYVSASLSHVYLL